MQELPHLKTLVQRYAADGFAILGVNTDRDDASTAKRCAAEGVTWTNIADGKERKLSSSWGVSGYPSAWLIDRDGIIRRHFLGIDPKELDTAVEALMKKD